MKQNDQSCHLTSVGIDIGTTTTQVIFSRLQIANTLPTQISPRLEITNRQILSRGEIHFTPLLDPSTIDAEGVKAIVDLEFRRAGLQKTDIDTGAIIITGQSVKKNNAQEVAHRLAEVSGDFVVATAGPHLEGFLAGRGSGAATRSKARGTVIANIDIGGGTSNLAVFKDGSPIDSCCLNIGGRLLRIIPEGIVTSISEEVAPFIANLGFDIQLNKQVTIPQLRQFTDVLAVILIMVIFKDYNQLKVIEQLKLSKELTTPSEYLRYLLVTEELQHNYQIDEIMFSGGVADYIYPAEVVDDNYRCNDAGSLVDICCYGDVGPLLGASLREALNHVPLTITRPAETIRATVTGAGVQSLRLSGATILIEQDLLPLKNIPVLKINDLAECNAVIRAINVIVQENGGVGIALALHHISLHSFADIRRTAEQISAICQALPAEHLPVIIITEQDCALVLGQTLRMSTSNRKIMCIDQIPVEEGDYIDIGSPIDNKAVPVVVKTLLFG